MTKRNHITAGRTTIRTFLAAVVLTAAVFGAVGTTTFESLDGKGNDPFPPASYESLAAFEEPSTAFDVIDGKGNDAFVYAFPINNVTVFGYQAVSVGRTLPQDMDPY